MKKWVILGKIKNQKSQPKAGQPLVEKIKIDEITDVILDNRGIKTKKEIEEFLDPKLKEVTVQSVGINKKQLRKALERIKKAIDEKEQIVVFGDYDVDGVCGTAILWETLHGLGAKALPYIPHRIDEGYGLSVRAIQNSEFRMQNPTLVITVDNGIVANEAVDFAKKQGIDVIITDHHVPSKKLPKANAIVHTTKLCGTGVAYLLSQEISNIKFQISNNSEIQNTKYKIPDDHLALVALATVADLVPLTGANRTLLKFGLEKLRKTKRPGLLALFQESVINSLEIGTYEIGHVIAPRLNAAGRIESAMDSLRLLCTNNREKARLLAFKLGSTNKERQLLTQETVQHAVTRIRNNELGIMNKGSKKKLLFIAHESYQPGVIGLVAGRLVEEFYRPSIVLSIGQTHSKASARSVGGFNIIEFIRSASEHLVDVGGHPMAAGFTVETTKISLLQKTLEELADSTLTSDLLMRKLRIDCEIPLTYVNKDFYTALQKLSPFGMGNPEPTFVSRNVVIEDMRFVGRESKHIKFRFIEAQPAGSTHEFFDAIAFGMGERAGEFHVGNSVDVVYTVDINKWNGNTILQLKVKDIKAV